MKLTIKIEGGEIIAAFHFNGDKEEKNLILKKLIEMSWEKIPSDYLDKGK